MQLHWTHHLIKPDSGFTYFREAPVRQVQHLTGRPIPLSNCELIGYETDGSGNATRMWNLRYDIRDGIGDAIEHAGYPVLFVSPESIRAGESSSPMNTLTASKAAKQIAKQRVFHHADNGIKPSLYRRFVRWFS